MGHSIGGGGIPGDLAGVGAANGAAVIGDGAGISGIADRNTSDIVPVVVKAASDGNTAADPYLVIYYVLVQTLENLQKQITMEQQMIFEKHLLEIQIEEQKKHSLLIMENAQQTRRMRHDLRHQLTAILGLSREDNAPLRQYIEELIQAIPVSPQIYCGNQAVNAIVSHYAALCEEQNVQTDIRITVPAHMEQMTDTELCVIFGNLLKKRCGSLRTHDGRETVHPSEQSAGIRCTHHHHGQQL